MLAWYIPITQLFLGDARLVEAPRSDGLVVLDRPEGTNNARLEDTMGGLKLGPETQRRVNLLFDPALSGLASRMLMEQCGNNIPFDQTCDKYQMERLPYAVLKLSGGDIDKLQQAINDATVDSRDVLMAAGFGDDIEAHRKWLADERK